MKTEVFEQTPIGMPSIMRARKSFTLIELLVVIGIIAILASLLLPVLKNAQGIGKRAVCLSNMKQICLGAMGYIDDYNGWIPARGIYKDSDGTAHEAIRDAPTAIDPYTPRATWGCPAATFATQSKPYLQIGWEVAMGYHSMFKWRNIRKINIPSKTCYAGDNYVDGTTFNDKGWYYGAEYIYDNQANDMMYAFRHNLTWNGLFLDGHAKSYAQVKQFQAECVFDYYEAW